MKTKILLFLLFTCSALTVAAQEVVIHDPSIKKDSTNLTINFSFKIDRIPSNAKLLITPILEGDSTKRLLDPIILIGRNMRIVMQRHGAVVPAKIKGKSNNIGNYTAVIPFEKWMNKVDLKIHREKIACTDTITYAKKFILGRNVVEPIKSVIEEHIEFVEQAAIDFPFIHPMEQYDSLTNGSKALEASGPKLNYKFNESQIDPNYNTNIDALILIKKAVQLISSTASVSHAKIIVYGTASPEGSEAYNKKLAQARADEMANYIGKFIASSYINTVNLGENWDGLKALIEQSEMPYRQEVLDIIDNYSVAEGRKSKLMNLHLGVPYMYIKEQFYPQLRSANYIQIFYNKKEYQALDTK